MSDRAFVDSAAALKGGAGTILTEDMSAGRSISGVRIENPFATG